MANIVHTALFLLILGLFFYSKLSPYKDRLNPTYKGLYNFFDKIFTAILAPLRSIMKPFTVGNGLQVDMTQVLLFIILLLILQIF